MGRVIDGIEQKGDAEDRDDRGEQGRGKLGIAREQGLGSVHPDDEVDEETEEEFPDDVDA